MKHKGLKTSLMLSILCLLVAVIALGAVTYAWFTFDPYTNVTPMEGKISGGEANLLISDKPTTGFAKSCVLVPEHMASALSPISTENLTDFFVSTYQEEGISKRFSQVSKDGGWKPEKYLIHGTVYLKSAGGGANVYFDKPPLDVGSDAQWLAAGRLGLKITGATAGSGTYIFSLDDLGSTSGAESRATIAPPAGQANQALVIRSVNAAGEPAFADDPATGLNGCIHGAAGAKALMTLKAEEVATVEYWLYLEGCDPNCYNPVQSKDIALQLGFAGDPT